MSAPGAEPPSPIAVGGSTYPLPLSGEAVMPGLPSPSPSGNVVPDGKLHDEVGQVYVVGSVPVGRARPMRASVGSMLKVLGGPQPVCEPVPTGIVGIDAADHTEAGIWICTLLPPAAIEPSPFSARSGSERPQVWLLPVNWFPFAVNLASSHTCTVPVPLLPAVVAGQVTLMAMFAATVRSVSGEQTPPS